jgi:uncharacterized protein (DUF1800 family)
MRRILLLTASAIILSASSSDRVNQNQIVHVLNRVSFGPRPGDLERVKQMGVWNYIEEQLNPANLPEPNFHSGISFEKTDPIVLMEEMQQLKEQEKQMKAVDNAVRSKSATKSALHQFLGDLNNQYATGKLERAVNSPRQLQEVMTEFWYEHFNVYINKGFDNIWVGPYEAQAIRPHVLGHFRELLRATCYHPAMLFYLDNWENSGPVNKGAKGKQSGLNENYARELMELHTLGVDGGYSQRDVVELARILTGLGIPRQGAKPNTNIAPVGPYGAVFDTSRHDFGDKQVLGRHFGGSGMAEIDEALNMLASHPSTAHHISYKLAQYFVSDTPPKRLVDRMSKRFLASDGDIKQVLEELFRSPEFWADKNENVKYKTPFRYAVSTLRATGCEPQNYKPVIQFLTQQGQPLYGCLTPDGYKNTKEAWLNPDSLLRRINFATAVGTGHLPDNYLQPPDYRRLGATISGGTFSPQTVATVTEQPEQLRDALLIGSPDFMHY